MKISELTGTLLDYWVQICDGWEHLGAIGTYIENDAWKPYCKSGANDWWRGPVEGVVCGPCEGYPLNYSTFWQYSGPLIEKYGIEIWFNGERWVAKFREWRIPAIQDLLDSKSLEGETHLIAVCRCIVASKYGDEVPDE